MKAVSDPENTVLPANEASSAKSCGEMNGSTNSATTSPPPIPMAAMAELLDPLPDEMSANMT